MSDVGAFGKFCVTHGWEFLAALVLLAMISPRCIRSLKSSEAVKFRNELIARSTFNALFFLVALMLLSQATKIGGLHKALGELHAFAASGGDPSIKIDLEEVNALWVLTARAWRSGAAALVCTLVGCWLQIRWLKRCEPEMHTGETDSAIDAPLAT